MHSGPGTAIKKNSEETKILIGPHEMFKMLNSLLDRCGKVHCSTFPVLAEVTRFDGVCVCVCVKAEHPLGGSEQLQSQCMCHLKAAALSRNVRCALCTARRALFLTVRAGRERGAALSPHVAVPGL